MSDSPIMSVANWSECITCTPRLERLSDAHFQSKIQFEVLIAYWGCVHLDANSTAEIGSSGLSFAKVNSGANPSYP